MNQENETTGILKEDLHSFEFEETCSICESDDCIICFEPGSNICTLCCNSKVHLHCLLKWTLKHPTCMICRREMTPKGKKDAEESNNDCFFFDDEDHYTCMDNKYIYLLHIMNRVGILGGISVLSYLMLVLDGN